MKTLSQINSWNRWNQLLVSASIFVFLPLQFPQVIRNFELINSGDPKAIATLAVIPAVGYASGMLGNLLLMNFLAGQREFLGTTVQAIGMATSGIVLAQLYVAGLIPPIVFIPFVAALAVGLVLNYFNFLASDKPLWSEKIWPLWRNCLRIAGVALLPAFVVLQLQDALFPSFPQWPSGLGVASLGSFIMLSFVRQQAESFPQFFAEQNRWRRRVLERSEWLDAWLRRGWQGLAGWTANLLFMFSTSAQLINCIVHPDSLSALSLSTQSLCVVGHLLMLSRSGTLLIEGKDRIWCVSSLWELIIRTGIFLCVTIAGIISPILFSVYLALVLGYLVFIYAMTKGEYEEASLLKTIEFLLFGRSSELISEAGRN